MVVEIEVDAHGAGGLCGRRDDREVQQVVGTGIPVAGVVRGDSVVFEVVGSEPTGFFSPTDIVVGGDNAFVADGSTGFSVFDVSNPSAPFQTRFVLATGAYHMELVGDVLFFVTLSNRLGLYGVAGGSPPVYASFISGSAADVAVVENHAYVVSQDREVNVVNVEDPDTPISLSRVSIDGRAMRVVGSQGYLYVAVSDAGGVNGSSGVAVLDLAIALLPVQVGFVQLVDAPTNLTLRGTTVYAALGDDGGAVVDVSDPLQPRSIGYIAARDNIGDIEVNGTRLIASDGGQGLFVAPLQECRPR